MLDPSFPPEPDASGSPTGAPIGGFGWREGRGDDATVSGGAVAFDDYWTASSPVLVNLPDRIGFAANGKINFSVDQAALRLVGGAPGWSSRLGAAFTVTYAYRASEPSVMPDDAAGFQRFNTNQIAQTELTLKAWSDVANISFVRVGSGLSGEQAYSNSATILFADYTSGIAGAAAFGEFPGNLSFSSGAGDVWVNSTLSYNTSPTTGNYGGQVLAHELGHAIGLDHPSSYNAEAGVSITYSVDSSYFEDSRQYTIMSYFSETNTGGNDNGFYASAPLLDDIAAAQLEYGANMTTRTGDTVYGFNATTGEPWNSIAGSFAKAVFAVWDAGGNDTLDFSGYGQAQTIDLRQGYFSSVGGLVGNVAIAVGADIENAIGGSGADTIVGNALANRLQGGGGDDTLNGGSGSDTAAYSGASSDYAWTKNADGSWTVRDLRTGAPDGTDVLTSIEMLQFTDRTVAISVDLPALVDTAFLAITRASTLSTGNATLAISLASSLASGALTPTQAVAEIVHGAQSTTSVATLAYEFFTGKAPSSGGMDYLVSPTGPNPNNLNAAYYQSFSLENRYINFAVNLGKVGEGNAAFTAKYGALTLFEATRTAYATIFGEAPSDAKLHAILDPTTVLNGVTFSRSDYFAYYGQDGANGIGTKAAMVGYLLAEAEKADVGTYAKSNDAFLTDVALHNAPFGVDLVGVYNQPGFVFHPG